MDLNNLRCNRPPCSSESGQFTNSRARTLTLCHSQSDRLRRNVYWQRADVGGGSWRIEACSRGAGPWPRRQRGGCYRQHRADVDRASGQPGWGQSSARPRCQLACKSCLRCNAILTTPSRLIALPCFARLAIVCELRRRQTAAPLVKKNESLLCCRSHLLCCYYSVQHKTHNGWTAFMQAAYHGQVSSVLLFLHRFHELFPNRRSLALSLTSGLAAAS